MNEAKLDFLAAGGGGGGGDGDVLKQQCTKKRCQFHNRTMCWKVTLGWSLNFCKPVD